jgi:hypothetical protein
MPLFVDFIAYIFLYWRLHGIRRLHLKYDWKLKVEALELNCSVYSLGQS